MTLRTLIPAIACVSTAAMAGFYGTFSTLVMPALRRSGPVEGMHAMQAINKAAPAPWLVLGLLVAGLSSVAAVVFSMVRREGVAVPMAGATAYWGSIVLTIAYNVPRNDRLAALAPGDAYWTTYLHQWVPANHVRTILSLVAAILFAVAVRSAEATSR